jgi:Tol biopolymer transport system component
LGLIGDSASDNPSISGDGRYVAFESAASNLVESDTNAVRDIFVHDRTTAATRRVSVDSSGAEADGSSSTPSLSADGRYVVFESWATNLVADDTNSQPDIFLHDLQTGETTRVCEKGKAPKLTSDGAYVAVGEWSPRRGVSQQVALFERTTGAVTLVSQTTGGSLGTNQSRLPAVSASGMFVAFVSDAINLVPEDSNGDPDVFLRDVLAGTTLSLVLNANGATVTGGSGAPDISSDGRYVVFTTAAALVAEDTNDRNDVYLYDTTTGVKRRVGLDIGGKQLPSGSAGGMISGDGKFVTYTSGYTYINRLD